jgi:hypothetical protein
MSLPREPMQTLMWKSQQLVRCTSAGRRFFEPTSDGGFGGVPHCSAFAP